MSEADVKRWLLTQHESETLRAEEKKHVLHCLMSLCRWYNEGMRPGHFLEAVLKNDFMAAVGRADSTNIKILPIYAKFLYNLMPVDYAEKAKKL